MVDATGSVGRHPSIALDSMGFPHISYFDALYQNDLRYAYKDEIGWHLETVDSEGLVGRHISLSLDAFDHPHISYQDYGNADLKYAYRTAEEWQIMTVDSIGMAGVSSTLALDKAGLPHIGYWHVSYCDLRYARGIGPESLQLSGEIVGTELMLRWNPVSGVNQYWIYGAADEPFFSLGSTPGPDYRITILPHTSTSWGSSEGIADPSAQWTYLVLAVDAMEIELGRSNRIGEYDIAMEIR